MLKTQTNNDATSFNKPLLLKLYKTSKKAEIEPAFRAKLANRQRHYPELEIFKIQLEEEQNDAHPHLYSEAKQKLFGYRMIFASFTLLFVFLAVIVQMFSLNWSYTFLFDSSIKAKWLVTGLTVFMALSSLACAFLPCTLHEATRYVVGKAKKSLQHIYEKQKIQNGFSIFHLWGDRQRRGSALRHLYRELSDKVSDKGEETYRLLKKIAKTPALTPKAKERLYNQALAELHDKATFVVHSFKHLEIDSTIRLQLS